MGKRTSYHELVNRFPGRKGQRTWLLPLHIRHHGLHHRSLSTSSARLVTFALGLHAQITCTIGNPHALLPCPLACLARGFVNDAASVVRLAVLDNFDVVVLLVLVLVLVLVLDGRTCTLDEMLSSDRGFPMTKYLPCISKVREPAAASTRPSLVSSGWECWPLHPTLMMLWSSRQNPVRRWIPLPSSVARGETSRVRQCQMHQTRFRSVNPQASSCLPLASLMLPWHPLIIPPMLRVA